MRDFFIEAFSHFDRLIIFLHVASSALLIGSLFVMRFIIQPVEVEVPDIKIKYSSCIKMLKRYLIFLIPILSIIILSSLFMHLGMGFKNGNPATYVMVHTKEALWTFIVFNFMYMYLKYRKAKKGLDSENYIEVEENVILMVKYIVPLNLVLALVSVYFGVVLRGF